MCALCSHDKAVVKAEMERLRMVADRLRRVAKYYDRLSYRDAIPHSDKEIGIQSTVKAAIRDLVEEWV